jgi:succinate dehydrogenase / fumarate reductase flavoprotein subunit
MIEGIRQRSTGERVSDLRKALQETMDRNVQVFRTEASMKEALGVIDELKERFAHVVVQDKGQRYNTDLLEAVELGFLIELAEVITLGALARKESRGGHFREDYEARDDVNFMRHTMAYREQAEDGSTSIRLDYKPVIETRYKPMERKY